MALARRQHVEATPEVAHRPHLGDVAGTPEQFKQWVLDELNDPKKAAELKSRSDEADAKMRARGLLNTK